MRVKFFYFAISLVGIGSVFSSLVVAQVPADKSLETLHAPPGVEITLWAEEPMVRNPTSMDIDSRGRVWVAEGLNYRLKQRSFEGLGRIEGADKIRILEDTDGDGRADKVTDFADDIFPVPLGLAVEEIWTDGKQTGTRVYVGNSPNFLMFEDLDGDDRADRRVNFLTGFKGIDSDHGLHGMTFGPDGKIYFTVGDTRYGADHVAAHADTFVVEDKSGQTVKANNFGTTLRVNRDGSNLQVMTSGHRNNYEAAVDSFGNVFGSDNDDDGNRGCRMYWVFDGGQYGYFHPRSRRHWAEEVPGVIPKLVGTGNGAPGGVVVYEGQLLPEAFRGAVLQTDSGTHQINAHPLKRHGGGFRTEYNVLLKGDDPWFRPVDLSIAPDGSVFVCDWYDAGVGGNLFTDQTTGRIYRLSMKGASAAKSFDGSKPIAGLKSPNVTTRLAALDQLVSAGAASRDQLLNLFSNQDPRMRARALHALSQLPQGTDDVVAALKDSDPQIREAAIRILGRDVGRSFVADPSKLGPPPATVHLEDLIPLAKDPDAGVRLNLLLALRNVSDKRVVPVLQTLAQRWDGNDRYYLEAIRAAMAHREPEVIGKILNQMAQQAIETGWDQQPVAQPPYYPVSGNDSFLGIDDQLPPANAASKLLGIAWVLGKPATLPAIETLLRSNQSASVEQIAAAALAEIDSPESTELLVNRFFDPQANDEVRIVILRALAEPAGRNKLSVEQANRVVGNALQRDALRVDAINLVVRTGAKSFASKLMRMAQSETQAESVRIAALQALGQLRHLPLSDLAMKLVDEQEAQPIAGPVPQAALSAGASLWSTDQMLALVSRQDLPLDLRRTAMQLVSRDANQADRLLAMLRNDTLAEALKSELSFLMHNHSDQRVRELARQAIPLANAKDQRIHRFDEVVRVPGNVERGKTLFHENATAACSRCHRVTGEGNLVGPDLASIGTKYGKQELLYHIQNPSGAINYSYVTHSFALFDGRVVSGLVLDRKESVIKLGLATGETTVIELDDVEIEKQQSQSLMPEGLIGGLDRQQVADLLEYLSSLKK